MSFDWTLLIALVLSVTVHEFSHAWMSTFLGDPTAKYQGRLSLNPLNHLDPIGTFMILYAHFGWGKPVPFNMSNLKNPRLDSALIALAGPLSNLMIAFLFAFPYRYLEGIDLNQSPFILIQLIRLMKTIIDINLILMVFNLLPIPPLDGSKIFALILPGDYIMRLHKYRNYGYGVLIILVFSHYITGYSILWEGIISPVVEFFWDIVLFAA
ncbi:MAG: site-2 protease family protein [Candidatus Gracilibacteria bacterium]|nr:site-2 protease family protein [Candidatus Gracilibacteria bacterium]